MLVYGLDLIMWRCIGVMWWMSWEGGSCGMLLPSRVMTNMWCMYVHVPTAKPRGRPKRVDLEPVRKDDSPHILWSNNVSAKRNAGTGLCFMTTSNISCIHKAVFLTQAFDFNEIGTGNGGDNVVDSRYDVISKLSSFDLHFEFEQKRIRISDKVS